MGGCTLKQKKSTSTLNTTANSIGQLEVCKHSVLESKPSIEANFHYEPESPPRPRIRIIHEDISEYYEFGKVLGQGGQGIVYKIKALTDRGTRKEGEAFAVKSLKKVDDEQTMRRNYKEIEIMQALDHPNIIKIWELFEDEEFIHIVMDYCAGGDLSYKLETSQFTELQVQEIMKKLMSVVEYMHSKQVYHRDIKLDNILLPDKDQSENICLIDFGLAKKIKPGHMSTHRLGSIHYMAPEVIQESYDQRWDVWAVGVVLHTLLAGYYPFLCLNIDDTENWICNDHLRLDGQCWLDISYSANALLRQMLNKNPERRISIKDAIKHTWVVNPIQKRSEGTLTKAYHRSLAPSHQPSHEVSEITEKPVLKEPPDSAGLDTHPSFTCSPTTPMKISSITKLVKKKLLMPATPMKIHLNLNFVQSKNLLNDSVIDITLLESN